MIVENHSLGFVNVIDLVHVTLFHLQACSASAAELYYSSTMGNSVHQPEFPTVLQLAQHAVEQQV